MRRDAALDAAPMLSSTIIPMPANAKDFEEKCCILFAGLLNDPNVKTVGVSGMKQLGLDIIGKRDRDAAQPVGIQCKLKTKGDRLTDTEVRKEVTSALTVKPALTEYYIVTTAPDDTNLDLLALTLSQEQLLLGRHIDIQIWGWDTLQQKIRADKQAVDAFDPGQSAATDRLLSLGAEAIALSERGLDGNDAILAVVTRIEQRVTGPLDPARGGAFDAHLDDLIDQYRDIMNAGRPRTALDLLRRLDDQLASNGTARLRARVRANTGIARLKLGDDAEAGRLLIEAYAINPEDPRIVANNVLGLQLSGRGQEAFEFAHDALTRDPTNAGVAAFLFQAAATASVEFDPYSIVPDPLRSDLNVAANEIVFLRLKRNTSEWRRLASEVYTRFPDEVVARRLAAEAMLDEVIGDHAFERRPARSAGERALMAKAADLLQAIWDEAKTFENAAEATWVSLACNLITARRALGQVDRAAAVADEILRIAPDDPDALLVAAHADLDRDEPDKAIERLLKLSASPERTMMLMNACSQAEKWADIVDIAETADRGAIEPALLHMFDTMLFRARFALGLAGDGRTEGEALLAAWPNSVGAHVVVADLARRTLPDWAGELIARARKLLSPKTPFGDRVMLSQLAAFQNDYDGVIEALDCFVPVEVDSEPLLRLTWAFANAGPRPRTRAFLNSLPIELVSSNRYARLAGVAEAGRGDLAAAEAHLRTAIAADPTDLRSHIVLLSVLERDGRSDEAAEHALGLDEAMLEGPPTDRMRLAHMLRAHGAAERALAIGYAAARQARDVEEVVAAYTGLIFREEAMPPAISDAARVGVDMWFDLEGNGIPDVQGMVEEGGSVKEGCFPPSHALSKALLGKAVGDWITLPSEFGSERRYRLRELKHKYIWLLHDILRSHATLFPNAKTMWEMTVEDGDIQPILDMVRRLQARSESIVAAYREHPLPIAAIAAMTGKGSIEFAEHLRQLGEPVRTCAGTLLERQEALACVVRARGQGAVLDTHTAYTAHRLGVLPALKRHFGQLVVPRSTVDEFLEMKARHGFNRGRDYFTLGFEGEQAVKSEVSGEDTERAISAIDDVVAALRANCEVAPCDGSEDLTTTLRALDRGDADQILDPIYLARGRRLLLLSEDLHLRQLAASLDASSGAWLQVALRDAADKGVITASDYAEAIGRLAALNHAHTWLDLPTLLALAGSTSPHADALFDSAAAFIGCRDADITSHMEVVVTFMRAVWVAPIAQWRRGRHVGKLLEQLVRFRSDWEAILLIIDHDLGVAARHGDLGADVGREYLRSWSAGHFLNIDFSFGIAERVAARAGRRRAARKRRA